MVVTPYLEKLFTVFISSSRRRHTMSLRDWSSDVCSSDLSLPVLAVNKERGARFGNARRCPVRFRIEITGKGLHAFPCVLEVGITGNAAIHDPLRHEIGRASCRDRDEE